MSILGLDHFTDISGTKLVDHIPDIGNSWIYAPGGDPPETIVITNNGVISQLVYDLNGDPDTNNVYYMNILPFANGYIQALYKNVLNKAAMLVARYDADSGFAVTLYPFPGQASTKWLFESDIDSVLIDFVMIPGTVARIEVVGSVATALFNGISYAQINTNLGAGRWGIEARTEVV